jgi:DNA-directed RNA polymerase specialized sigma subunit
MKEKKLIQKTDYDQYDMTQQEVAEVLGMSRAHVGSIETRAKQKIKAALEKRGFKLNDLIWR